MPIPYYLCYHSVPSTFYNHYNFKNIYSLILGFARINEHELVKGKQMITWIEFKSANGRQHPDTDVLKKSHLALLIVSVRLKSPI